MNNTKNHIVRDRKARGFTLIELLIVVAIIGILAFAISRFFGNRGSRNMQNPSCAIVGAPGR